MANIIIKFDEETEALLTNALTAFLRVEEKLDSFLCNQEPAPKKKATKKKEEPADQEQVAEPEAPKAEAEPVQDVPTVTLDEVKARVTQCAQTVGQAETKAILAKVGASRVSEVKADKYAELIELLDKRLEAHALEAK